MPPPLNVISALQANQLKQNEVKKTSILVENQDSRQKCATPARLISPLSPYAARFFFMFYGKRLCTKHFQGCFSVKLIEGTIDKEERQLVYMKLSQRIRANQLINAIHEFNECSTGHSTMKLTSIPGHPEIMTMKSKRLSGYIHCTIQEDKQHKIQGRPSNYWVLNLMEKENSDTEEYDVVKKRRAMESAPSDEEEDEEGSVPEVLADFEEFEASVLPALERISLEERDYREREMLEMEEILASGGVVVPGKGGVYFAWSPCLRCMKIGATRRDDPLIRLRELSMQVTEPYHLAAWMPTPTPFRAEKDAHRHFQTKRINTRGAGAGTEFFRVNSAVARAYVAGEQ